VELVLAAGLGMLGLAVVATVVRGPMAALRSDGAVAEGAVPGPAREALLGAVRSARSGPDGSAVLAAGPTHVVLRTGPAGEWWRLSLVPDGVMVDVGAGPPPTLPAGPGEGRRIARTPEPGLVLILRDRRGDAIDPSDAHRPGGTVVVELRPAGAADGDPGAAVPPGSVAVSLRDPP
jgi:hypothetical protein